MRTRRRARIAAIGVALAAALATVSPLGTGTAVAAPAAPTELVIPSERYATPDAGRIQAAGATGFLRGDERGGLKWVPYSGGTVTPYPNPAGGRIFGTGKDLIARLNAAADKVDLTTVQGEVTTTVAIPSGQRFAAMMGTEVITHEYKDGVVVAIHALSVVDGVAKDRTVWGFQPGTTDIAVQEGDNPKGFLLSYQRDGAKRTAWIKTANLYVWELQNALDVSASGSDVFVVTPEKRLQVWGADVFGGNAPRYELDWPEEKAPIGMVGSHVIARSASDPEAATLTDYEATGAMTPHAVLTDVRGDTRVTPDGRLLAVKFGSEEIRTVHALRHDINGGALYTNAIYTIPFVPTARERIAVAQGELSAVDQVPWEQPRLRGTRLSVVEPLTAQPVQDRGTGPDFGAHCEQESDCPVLVPTGDGRVVYRNARQELVVLDAGKQLPGTTVVDGGVVGDVEASGRYASFRALDGMQKVLDLDTREVVFDRGGIVGRVTSLEGGTLWAEGATAGTVDAFDVRTGATLRSVKLADCTLKDLQVRLGSAYWTCGGTSGVTDLNTKTTVALPGHDTAVLGDGYVAHALDGTLSLTQLRDDKTTRTIGRPADARPGFGWAVDRFSGHLAWVDELQRTHVTPSGVKAPNAYVLDSRQPTGLLDRKAATPQTWSAKWWFSKPVRHWNLTITSTTSDQSRTLQSWEQVRGALEVNWDGTDSAGQPMPDGLYSWTLTAEAEYEFPGVNLYQYGEVALTRLNSLASGRYQPVSPARVMDTRSGIGAPKAKVGPGGTVSLQVAGRGGVPESSAVTSVVLNVTATNPTSSTFVSVYPYGTTRTSASNLNVVAGQTVPNLVVVPVKDGKVTFYNRAGSVDLIADVAGYYWPAQSGSLYAPVTPNRVMDTRSGIGVPKAKLGADQTVSLTVTGKGGVPATDVTAVVLNVTATNPTASTFISVYPYGTTRTSASNLNVVAGQTVPNLVVVPVKDGKVTFYNRAGSVDLIADVAGYFTSAASGSLYEPVTPDRLMDTRSGIGVAKAKVGAGETVSLTVTGKGGVPATDVTAVILNVTATNATASTFISVYPYGTTRTSASNLNVVAGQTVPNLVVVPVKDGKVTFYNRAGTVDLIADVAGYYSP